MISGIASSFASVTILKVLSRVLQFILRVYLIREVLSPEILAEMVALDLILTTSLHIAKNCFKPSYQQVQSNNQKYTILSSMNLMTIGIITTICSAGIVIVLQWNHKIQLKYVNQSIIIYGVCGILQSIKQKYSVQFIIKYQYRKLALIQLFSYLPKTLLLFIGAKVGLFEEYGILMFASGQLFFTTICLFITIYLTNYKILTINTLDETGIYFDKKTKKILKQISLISLLKLIVQQFEKIILVISNTIQYSSIYTLVANLGSIIVRFIFSSLQQIAYNYYTRGDEEQSKKTLIEICKIIAIFSILCTGFGWRYAENVLVVLYGEKWVSYESVFAFQCYMVLLGVLGINGTMETFVVARADVIHTIPKLKYYTILNAMIFIVSSLLLLQLGLGAAGLFIGNILGMITRIIINWNLQIKKHLIFSHFIKEVIPNKMFVILVGGTLFGSFAIKSWTMSFNHLVDLAIGVALSVLTMVPVLYSYKQQISTYIRKAKNKEVQKQE